MVRSVSGLVQANAPPLGSAARHPRFLLLSQPRRAVFWGELRATGITFDETAAGFLREAVPSGVINVIANEPNERDEQEYRAKLRTGRTATRITAVSLLAYFARRG